MDSNLMQCDTLVAVLLLVIAGYRPFIGQNALNEKYDVYRTILLRQFFAVIWILK